LVKRWQSGHLDTSSNIGLVKTPECRAEKLGDATNYNRLLLAITIVMRQRIGLAFSTTPRQNHV
jgi:hypothetical protein